MDKKFLVLVAVFIALGFGVYTKFSNENKSSSESVSKEFISNEILGNTKKIEIISKEDKTVLKLDNGKWVVENRFSWESDFSKIKSLIDDIKSSKIVHEFKQDEEALRRLNLLSPNGEKNENSGVLINFKNAEDKTVFSLIKGKRRDKGGQYFIRDMGKNIILSENEIYIAPSPKEWIKDSLINIGGDKIAKVTAFNSKNKKIYGAQKNKETLEYDLKYPKSKDLPDQEKLKKLFSSLENLELKDLEKGDMKTYGSRILFETENGSSIQVALKDSKGDKKLIFIKILKKDEKDKIELAENIEDFIFSVSNWDFEKFLSKKEDLFKKEK